MIESTFKLINHIDFVQPIFLIINYKVPSANSSIISPIISLVTKLILALYSISS